MCARSRIRTYPLAMRVFSDLVMTFKSGLTFVAQEAIYSSYNVRMSMFTYGFR